jgi:hypothetical protein
VALEGILKNGEESFRCISTPNGNMLSYEIVAASTVFFDWCFWDGMLDVFLYILLHFNLRTWLNRIRLPPPNIDSFGTPKYMQWSLESLDFWNNESGLLRLDAVFEGCKLQTSGETVLHVMRVDIMPEAKWIHFRGRRDRIQSLRAIWDSTSQTRKAGLRITGFFGLFPSSGVLENRKHDANEVSSF